MTRTALERWVDSISLRQRRRSLKEGHAKRYMVYVLTGKCSLVYMFDLGFAYASVRCSNEECTLTCTCI